ncbi:hypothetical protein O3G_MSEX003181 [Manduca sexta]|uniref:Uncharacterized protein n=1 Tax=Manduca sexta TaxID=7130 RepID=A0A921YRJ5_MANSE|nr:hypothetical protein O3G_MSEX003181 [Manduca sexta]
MNFTSNHRNLRLLSRNEGKIKSYESCCDVTAWSHDLQKKGCYLREWMKSDMPICVIPVCTLASFLKIMTCRSRGKTTPRCHPDCKSKILLESICTSCHAMKECLKNNEEFEKYFEEEEFETSNWPCERCLDALKSIKMFWKILLEKIFNVNIIKNTDFNSQNNCIRTDSIRSVTKEWQNEIVHQALFLKNITPLGTGVTSGSPRRVSKVSTKVSQSACGEKPCLIIEATKSDKNFTEHIHVKTNSEIGKPRKSNIEQKNSTGSNKIHSKRPCRKLSRCTSVRVKMNDVGCSTHNIDDENEELKTYKNNFEQLQQQFNVQITEIEKLQKENTSLRIELQDVYKHFIYKPSCCTPDSLMMDKDTGILAPKPFENCMDENVDTNSIKDIDSEMIITMKNCKNNNFKHVSLLQVLHKTNEPMLADVDANGPSNRNEDPIYLLAKVQTTFGAIVQREMSIASDRRHRPKCNIEATFQRINSSKSVPSCSTVSAYSTNSETNLIVSKNI